MSSAELRDYVVRGRAFRAWRETHMDDADAEARTMSPALSMVLCRPLRSIRRRKRACSACRSARISTGRGIVRLVRIARTIADVAESERVTQDHVLEAAMYQGRRDQ